ncbi:substrate-binding domain-containing protein [Kurthia huakuii]|uniref:substrate-binding domain-containing protein n=1 Tax=Kurthia huakuii TaxID=1421019 RepID=UPI00049529B5|nr:helix-turn-helix transcriptional regulator [Kurthia huakuii]MBM7698569.1 putative molybdopterin biosynthesis protein [Kurthia huakuii]
MTQETSYTIEEVAQLLKVSKLTIYDLVKKGELPVFKVGRQMRLAANDLDAYIAKHRINSTNEQQTIIISGQDLALDRLGKHIEQRLGYKVLRSHEGSFNGLITMYQGNSDIASLHLYDGDTAAYNLPYIRKVFVSHRYILLRLLTRKAGFYVAKGNPLNITSIADLQGDVRLMNREKGSGIRTLLDELLRTHGISSTHVTGYEREEKDHVSVATAVASGAVDVGVGIEKTARLVDVDFVPLIDEHYDIVLLKNAGNEAFIATVRAILEDPVYRQEIRAMGGYDVAQMGTVVFETI